MKGVRWFSSPLAGTAVVLAGLCLLAIPLRKLTSARPVTQVAPAAAVVSTREIPAVLRIKLLDPANRVALQAPDGTIVLGIEDPVAGESEYDVQVRLTDDEIDLDLVAEFADEASETAVFVTLMPDGYEERTAYATGAGRLEESLRFDWHQPDGTSTGP